MTITQQMTLGVLLGLCGIGLLAYSLQAWDEADMPAGLFLTFQTFGVGAMGGGVILVFVAFMRMAV